jgi:drug/metabolite transporter (DMT)-like permease
MNPTRRPQILAIGALAGLSIAWGAIPLFVRNDVPSIQLVGTRVTFGAIALIAAAAAVGRLTIPKMRRWRLALSGVLLALHWVTFFESIKLTTVAVALAVLYLGPIAAAILAGPLFGEHVDGRIWGALAVAVLGTLMVVQPWQSNGVDPAGIAMAALSAALLTGVMLAGKPVAKDLGGLTMATGELIVASVLLAPATYQALTVNGEFIANYLVLGVLFTGLAGFVFWESMRHVPMAAVSVVMYLEPASAVVWAAIFLEETPNAMAWIGVALVIFGGMVAATATGKEQDAIGAQAAL